MQTKQLNNEYKLLSISEVSEILGIDRTSVKTLFDTKQLNYVVIGKQKRTSLFNINLMLKYNQYQPQPIKKEKIKHTGLVSDMTSFINQFKN